MSAIRIEILNPKAMKLLQGMQDLKLIKVSDEPVSELSAYLEKMRQHSETAPSEDEIANMVKEVRAERYGKK